MRFACLVGWPCLPGHGDSHLRQNVSKDQTSLGRSSSDCTGITVMLCLLSQVLNSAEAVSTPQHARSAVQAIIMLQTCQSNKQSL